MPSSPLPTWDSTAGLLRLWLRQPELVGKHAVEVPHVAQQYDFLIRRCPGAPGSGEAKISSVLFDRATRDCCPRRRADHQNCDAY